MVMNSEFSKKKPCIVFVANRGLALKGSRLLLIQHFLSLGWQVVAATTRDDYAEQLLSAGVIVEPVIFYRSWFSPWQDIRALHALIKIYRKYRPCLTHHFNDKPIVFGNLSAHFVGGAKVVNNMEGLGYAFVRRGIRLHMAVTSFRLMLPRSDATIFLNPDDRKLFLENGWIPESKACLIVSTGVDTQRFCPGLAPRHKATRVLMATRLLWQKGIREFVEAAEIVKRERPTVRFQLAGEWDSVHPDAVDQEWIHAKVNRGSIEFLGYLNNMADQLRDIDIFVLPSYREGVPRVLLEAAACGVPIVTTDAPGCRETVVDGETGRVVPPRDSTALAEAITELLTDPSLRHRMGQAGRRLVEKEFDAQIIAQKYLDVYHDIGIDVGIWEHLIGDNGQGCNLLRR
jgi:glycosyltransferase involved in cell wall biosynthesis